MRAPQVTEGARAPGVGDGEGAHGRGRARAGVRSRPDGGRAVHRVGVQSRPQAGLDGPAIGSAGGGVGKQVRVRLLAGRQIWGTVIDEPLAVGHEIRRQCAADQPAEAPALGNSGGLGAARPPIRGGCEAAESGVRVADGAGGVAEHGRVRSEIVGVGSDDRRFSSRGGRPAPDCDRSAIDDMRTLADRHR